MLIRNILNLYKNEEKLTFLYIVESGLYLQGSLLQQLHACGITEYYEKERIFF